jgi:hypothetical protein
MEYTTDLKKSVENPDIKNILDDYAEDRKTGYSNDLSYHSFAIKICVITAMDPANRELLLKSDIIPTKDVEKDSVDMRLYD